MKATKLLGCHFSQSSWWYVARGTALVQSDEQLRSETGRPREVHRSL